MPFDGKNKITVRICSKTEEERQIEAKFVTDISDSFLEYLKTARYRGVKFDQCWSIKHPKNEIEENFFDELSRMQTPLTEAVEKIIRYHKYFLGEIGIKKAYPYVVTHWSLDEKEWRETQSIDSLFCWKEFVVYPVKGYSTFQETLSIQKCVDLNVEPFFAFDYIYQAENFEDNPRRQWILTTIALEYALKEFLLCRDPIFESFVIDSKDRPSLSQLYSRIYYQLKTEGLHICFGNENFDLAVQIRNYLIHRPKDFDIEKDEANIYTYLASITIRQLFASINTEFPYYSDMTFSSSDLNDNFPRSVLQKKLEKYKERV